MSEKIAERGLSAQAQAESLKFKLLQGMVVRRACYSVIKSVMESQAKGVEVVVAGKLRGQRAKAMKFREGYMVKVCNRNSPLYDFKTNSSNTIFLSLNMLYITMLVISAYLHSSH